MPEDHQVPGDSVRIRGRHYPVIERFRIHHRTYLAIEKLSHPERQRFKVFDPHAGPGGLFAVLHVLPSSRETVERIRLLQKLNTGNQELPQIRDYQKTDDGTLVVLNWVDGTNLRSRLNRIREGRQRPMGAPEVIRLIRGLAHGLAHLHRHRGIIHADVKPANLILTPNPTCLALIDYGSAWRVARTTKRGTGDGVTGPYAAPEVLRRDDYVSSRADYFSLCAVCYEMLTATIPYDGLGGNAGLPEHRHEMESTLVPPSELSPDSGRVAKAHWQRIDRLVCRGLALDADNRHRTVDEWLNEWNETHSQFQQKPRQGWISRGFLRVIDWLDGERSGTGGA